MLPKAVGAYLDQSRPRALEGLLELLRFASVSSASAHEHDCRACVAHIERTLLDMGFATDLRPWRTHPILLARSTPALAPPGAPTVLFYGHYDVQPVEPVELWRTPPFEPVVRDGAIHARGASDDKGQFFAHFMAAEAFLRTQGRLPVNVIFFLEGEEEIGSPELEKFVTAAAGQLKADHCVISDSEFFAPHLPSLTYGLRGLVYLELTLTGPKCDLHSGVHGGAVVNPLNAIARMVAALHDEFGKVTLPGYYDDVAELSDAERRAWRELPFDEGEYAATLGTLPVGGERGLGVLERRWARPTLDCNGIVGGHMGEGSKTVLPSKATAKISMRLVPNQDPAKVVAAFGAWVADHTPAGVTASLKIAAESRPVLIPPDSPAAAAGKAALAEAFGGSVALIRNGASVPITELFQRVLGLEPVLMGFGLPTDNLHAPNEHFRLEQFYGGIVASAAIMQNLSQAPPA